MKFMILYFFIAIFACFPTLDNVKIIRNGVDEQRAINFANQVHKVQKSVPFDCADTMMRMIQ